MSWQELNPGITGGTDMGGRRVKARAVRYDPESKVIEARLRLADGCGRESSRVILTDGEFQPDDRTGWERVLSEGSA
jgi:hypothetical protein